MKSLCLLAVVPLLLVGCSAKQAPSLAEVNDTNIKKLRGAYGLFTYRHNLRGPESEEELKEFLRTNQNAQVKLSRMGVSLEEIDEIFVSERDGQPFRVRYGLRGVGDHAVVFEAEGVDGKRLVALATPQEVDAVEYERLWKQKRPAPPAQSLAALGGL